MVLPRHDSLIIQVRKQETVPDRCLPTHVGGPAG